VEARQHQNGSERGSRFMLGSQRSHCHNKQIQALLTAARASGGKDECQVRLMMMIAFITFKSSLVPMFEGL